MKTIFQIILVNLIAFNLYSQIPISYEGVDSLENSISKDKLYNRGNNWFVDIFKNPQKVIQLNDKENGQIVGKGSFPYQQTKFIWGGSDLSKGNIGYTIKLFFKDGRYKYVITDFTHDNGFGLITDEKVCPAKIGFSARSWRNKIWNDIKMQCENHSSLIIESLKESMTNKSEIENDDW